MLKAEILALFKIGVEMNNFSQIIEIDSLENYCSVNINFVGKASIDLYSHAKPLAIAFVKPKLPEGTYFTSLYRPNEAFPRKAY